MDKGIGGGDLSSLSSIRGVYLAEGYTTSYSHAHSSIVDKEIGDGKPSSLSSIRRVYLTGVNIASGSHALSSILTKGIGDGEILSPSASSIRRVYLAEGNPVFTPIVVYCIRE